MPELKKKWFFLSQFKLWEKFNNSFPRKSEWNFGIALCMMLLRGVISADWTHLQNYTETLNELEQFTVAIHNTRHEGRKPNPGVIFTQPMQFSWFPWFFGEPFDDVLISVLQLFCCGLAIYDRLFGDIIWFFFCWCAWFFRQRTE